MPSELHVLVINRDQDVDRWEFVTNNLKAFSNLTIERIPAIDGHAEDYEAPANIPSGYTTTLKTPSEKNSRAVSACFLSHVKAWAHVANSNLPYSLIVEDDAGFTSNLWSLPQWLDQAPDFDLVFVNERTVRFRTNLPNASDLPEYLSVDDFHRAAAERLPEGHFESRKIRPDGYFKTAPGADGYVISAAGAKKLLSMLSNLTRFVHVDHFLYVSGLKTETIDTAKQKSVWVRNDRAAIGSQKDTLHSFIAPEPRVLHQDRYIGGTVLHTNRARKGKHFRVSARTSAFKPAIPKARAPQAFVHLGFHKTGTTYIQKILNRNKAWLSDEFLIVNQAEDKSRELRQACQSVHKEITANNDPSSALSKVTGCAAKIRDRALQTDRQILISDEEMAGLMLGRQGCSTIYPALRQIAEAIRDGLAPIPTTFVFYNRNPLNWIKAVHNQGVKRHRVTQSFEAFRANAGDVGAILESRLSELAKAVGPENLLVLNFEQDCKADYGLSSALFRALGLEDQAIEALEKPGPLNTSLGPKSLELMREVNALNLGWKQTSSMLSIVQKRQDLLDGAKH